MGTGQRRNCHRHAGFRYGHLSVPLFIRLSLGDRSNRGWATMSGSQRHHVCATPSASTTPRAHVASLVATVSSLPSRPHCASHHLQATPGPGSGLIAQAPERVLPKASCQPQRPSPAYEALLDLVPFLPLIHPLPHFTPAPLDLFLLFSLAEFSPTLALPIPSAWVVPFSGSFLALSLTFDVSPQRNLC